MAARHFSFKTGKAGGGAKHAAYIAGVGKYAERDDVRHMSDHNMPGWAEDGRDFFAAADKLERANGRVYSEIEFAVPRECADPVRYAQEYAARLLGDRHPYRLAVHDKLAADGGRNVHGHLMFTERRLDGIERDRDQFFRRANSKHPERGGTAKDRQWNDRKHIDQLRRGYEAHAKDNGIRLDLRSNMRQGVDRVAEPKIGPERKGRRDRWREQRSGQVAHLRDTRRQMDATRIELALTSAALGTAQRVAARQEAAKQAAERAAAEREAARQQAIRKAEQQARQGRWQAWQARQVKRHGIALAAGAKPQIGKPAFWRYTEGKAAGIPAVIDYGDRLQPAGKRGPISDAKVRAMLEVAKLKGWQGVSVTGPADFRLRVAEAAQARGLKVLDQDLAQALAQRAEQAAKQAAAEREAARQAAARAEQAKARTVKPVLRPPPTSPIAGELPPADNTALTPEQPPAPQGPTLAELRKELASLDQQAAAIRAEPGAKPPPALDAELAQFMAAAEANKAAGVKLHPENKWESSHQFGKGWELHTTKLAHDEHRKTERPRIFGRDAWDAREKQLTDKMAELRAAMLADTAKLALRARQIQAERAKEIDKLTLQAKQEQESKAARLAELAEKRAGIEAQIKHPRFAEQIKQEQAQQAKQQDKYRSGYATPSKGRGLGR